MKKSLQYCVSFFAFTAVMSSATFAQDAVQTSQRQPVLEEIIVTAARIPQRIEQIGSTVSILSARQLERQQIDVLSDGLKLIPGVAITRSGGTGQLTQVRMRGFTTKHVLTMIDGVKLNNPSATSNQFGIENLFLGNVERIEVLRGPQSGLYGADAVAGVINIITRRGQGDPKFRGSALYGSHNTFDVSGQLSGGIDDLGYVFGASYYNTDGISLASRPPGNQEEDGYRNLTLNGRIDWAATEDIDVFGWVRYIDAKNETDNNFLPANNPQRLPAFLFQDSPGFAKNKQFFAALRGTWRTLDDKLVHNVQLSNVNLDTQSVTPTAQQEALGRTLEANYYATFYFTESTFILAGADYRTEKGRFGAPRGVAFAAIDRTQWNRALFATANIGLTDGFYVSGALRRDDNEEFGVKTTYRVTSAYNFPDTFDIADIQTKIRASYGTGAEAPALRQQLGQSPTFRGNPDLQPESNWMWDIGIEQALENGFARWSLTYYKGRATNGIFNVTTVGISRPVNVDSPVDMRGFEADFIAQPLDWLELNFAYTRADSYLVSNRIQLFGRPKHEFSGAITVKPTEKLTATFDGYLRSKFFSDFPSSFQMPSYEVFGITLGYVITPSIRLTAKMQNLFDKIYEEKLGDSAYGRTMQLRVNVVF